MLIYNFVGTALKKNTVLKELWIANNDLTSKDALSISSLLKTNFYLQFIDISNNNIQVIIYNIILKF